MTTTDDWSPSRHFDEREQADLRQPDAAWGCESALPFLWAGEAVLAQRGAEALSSPWAAAAPR